MTNSRSAAAPAGARGTPETVEPAASSTYLQRFGLRLKLARVMAHLTQEQLAERARMHRTFIGLLERGESGINIERLPDLASALGVEPADLLPPLTVPPEEPSS